MSGHSARGNPAWIYWQERTTALTIHTSSNGRSQRRSSLHVADGIPPARLHDAGHTAATLLLEQGVDIRIVQQILGHSPITVTKRYAHVTSRLARDAADRMGRALSG
ncbi:tyrosine-type recombinase/integrase [Kribbella sp. NPDC026596]|uniref:tyrosine-type recombinase/integrase n=1 Tax=Kribbella sp. NPDC026596 TaxID=3155122 RepID=UPI0033E7E112